MTISFVTIIEPVAIPGIRPQTMLEAGWWVAHLRSGSLRFTLRIFCKELFHQWWNEDGREGGGVFARVIFTGFVGASRCTFYCSSQLINYIRTARLQRS